MIGEHWVLKGGPVKLAEGCAQHCWASLPRAVLTKLFRCRLDDLSDDGLPIPWKLLKSGKVLVRHCRGYFGDSSSFSTLSDVSVGYICLAGVDEP